MVRKLRVDIRVPTPQEYSQCYLTGVKVRVKEGKYKNETTCKSWYLSAETPKGQFMDVKLGHLVASK